MPPTKGGGMEIIMKRQKNNNNDGDYRCVEAMYRRGCTVDDIVNSTGISKMDVLDITQKIFALDMKKRALN